MANWTVRRIADNPQWMQEAAAWFADKWGIPADAYIDSMKESCTATEKGVPQWFVVRECDDPASPLVAGCGIIQNDFHDRPDLAPNLCALYVDARHRGKGIARRLLDCARSQAGACGIAHLYLVTDLVGFYEKCGWEFWGHVNDSEGNAIRMYHAPTRT